MNDVTGARVRLAIAEIEERQIKEKSIRSAARWRLILAMAGTVALTALAVFFQITRIDVSGRNVACVFLVYLVSRVWADYRTEHDLRQLRAEMDRLKDEIQKLSD
jgi:uncharacterized membrane protein YqjE